MNRTVRAGIAGAVAGLAGSLAMNAVSALWATRSSVQNGEPTQHGTRPDVAAAQEGDAEEHLNVATVKVAEQVTAPLRDRPLTVQEKDQGGKAVHYAFGAGAGAVYGAAVQALGCSRTATGVGYGLVVWVGGILVALPALRLTASPRQYSLGEHALGVAGHVMYGAVLGRTYRALSPRS